MSNQGVGKAAFLLEALRKDPSPCLSQFLEATCTPGLTAPSSVPRASSAAASLDLSLTLNFSLSPPHFKDLVIPLGSPG